MSDFDEPNDKAIKRIEANIIVPKRGFIEEISEERKEYRFRESDDFQWLRIWELPLRGFTYCSGWDFAEGKEIGDGGATDYSVGRITRRGIVDKVKQEIAWNTGKILGDPNKPAVVAMYRGNHDMIELAYLAAQLGWFYNWMSFEAERNAMGIGFIDALKKIYLVDLILHSTTIAENFEKPSGKYGMLVGSSNKPALMSELKTAVRDDKYQNWDAEFCHEARHYVNRNGKLGAEPRFHDDIIMAEAHMWRCHLKAPMERPRNLHTAKPREKIVYKPRSRITGY